MNKVYLLYLFGALTEYHSQRYPNNRFWKNDNDGVVLDLRESGSIYVHDKIWNNFSLFFSLQYNETQQVMKDLLEEHLKLMGITPEFLLFMQGKILEEHLKLEGIAPINY
jgi:hypothetical protein